MPDDSEIRTGKFIGFFFTLPCLGVSLLCVHYAWSEPWFLLVLPFFLLGLAAGLCLLLKPRRLVRVHDGFLELHSGSLFTNPCLIRIPVVDLHHFEVRRARPKLHSQMEGWYLVFDLRRPPDLSPRATRWLNWTTPSTETDKCSPERIAWLLNWPEGGAVASERKLRGILSAHDMH